MLPALSTPSGEEHSSRGGTRGGAPHPPPLRQVIVRKQKPPRLGYDRSSSATLPCGRESVPTKTVTPASPAAAMVRADGLVLQACRIFRTSSRARSRPNWTFSAVPAVAAGCRQATEPGAVAPLPWVR